MALTMAFTFTIILKTLTLKWPAVRIRPHVETTQIVPFGKVLLRDIQRNGASRPGQQRRLIPGGRQNNLLTAGEISPSPEIIPTATLGQVDVTRQLTRLHHGGNEQVRSHQHIVILFVAPFIVREVKKGCPDDRRVIAVLAPEHV